ncbi:hypothetical protein EIN_162200 [Entamoeba invadens IP1]|uniref:SDE2-like domain-containing protein n=1 Tax=Entamoeba invadens IP1 TaxID=370355 RepID=A0A0A1TYJ1_ENTIV|nr:hypothetical protein EIN_162200 [Entamoeba invadens IP1]ELP86586.1 hypothetical protein EIN_162200 [Entamoeba invadens IP1]|eukprot:XP_004185932.1 hypothetical protein EIN_162200 [Entamoeba invadens IP1]
MVEITYQNTTFTFPVYSTKLNVSDAFKIPEDFFYLTDKGGRYKTTLRNGDSLRINIRGAGGKGGFGALLKDSSQRVAKEKLPEDYFDMSRDLETGKRVYKIREEAEKEEKKHLEQVEKAIVEKREEQQEKEVLTQKQHQIEKTEQTIEKLRTQIREDIKIGGMKRKRPIRGVVPPKIGITQDGTPDTRDFVDELDPF